MTTHPPIPAGSRPRPGAAIAVVCVLSIVLAGCTGSDDGHPAAGATGAAWGPQGAIQTTSAATVRWDGTGAATTDAAADVLTRDGAQPLPHTDGRSYADLATAERTAAHDRFGGIQVAVSQTDGLGNQYIDVDISGAKPGDVMQLFQCWGTPNTPETATGDRGLDPAHCQVGPTMDAGGDGPAGDRAIAGDRLVGGDWAGQGYAPFAAVDGTTLPGESGGNPLYSARSTNEVAAARVDDAGRVSRRFEVQTTRESSALGCGVPSDQTSTADCWLVIVPRTTAKGAPSAHLGPLAPSTWAQRIQVHLGFRALSTPCEMESASAQAVGSELVQSAMAAWAVDSCGSGGPGITYTVLSENVARQRYAAGQDSVVVAVGAVPDPPADGSGSAAQSLAVPIAVTGPVLAYSLPYTPHCTGDGSADEDGTRFRALAADAGLDDAAAMACGYADRDALRQDAERAGQPVTELRLTARLVAKLLTQSYQDAILSPLPHSRGNTKALVELAAAMPQSLLDDPEFQSLNPDLSHMFGTWSGADAPTIARSVVELARSDSAAAVWRWIRSDPDARPWLHGCPDPAGRVVNPFFSARTFDECAGDADALAATEQARRAAAWSGETEAPAYDPADPEYPAPVYTAGGTPRSADGFLQDRMEPIAEKILTSLDAGRAAIGVTTAAFAAERQLPTAFLCDAAGQCAGAGADTLSRAAAGFSRGSAGGVPSAPDDPDQVLSRGGYPLAVPVTLSVAPALMPGAQRAAMAKALAEAVRTDSVADGYAPLEGSLRDAATDALDRLSG